MLLKQQLSAFSQWFWNEDVWLPPGTTWAHIRDTSKVRYAQIEQLYGSIYVAVVLFFVRIAFERWIFMPLGRHYGLKGRPKIPSMGPAKDAILEKAFRQHGHKIPSPIATGITKQLDCSDREVQRWWRQRARCERPSTLEKLAESAWRGTFYAFVFCFGLWCLSDKPWLWDTMHCWYNFPHHNTTNDVWWYYMIELGFYLSLMFSQFMDVKRKDFWEMFVHHIVTILLLTLSWACNLTRIGTLVMILHDFADVPLEAAKVVKYLKMQKAADILFVVFTLAWVVSRLGLYPYRVIYSTAYQATFVIKMFSAYYIFNSLLLALQLLHVIWTVFIVKVVMQALSNQDIKDLRSEDESSSTEEKEDEDRKRRS